LLLLAIHAGTCLIGILAGPADHAGTVTKGKFMIPLSLSPGLEANWAAQDME
jgi:hypothetical protein